jgi:sodium transport system permease protein
MAPGAQLNLGNSLIPVTGVVLLLRTMLEGNYLQALPYVPLVIAVTLGCCWLAIRWATNQFNSESVLFRESERWDPSLWLKHLRRDREATPSFAEAMACGVLILMLRFFLGFALGGTSASGDMLLLAAITQLVVVLTPAILMTVMLTRSPATTLLLRRPTWSATLGAALLALLLYPSFNLLHTWVMRIYPLPEGLTEQLQGLESGLSTHLGRALFVLALLPAVCEELAFRGFILSGFRRLGHKWTAIVGTSIFFALTHSVFQQSLLSCVLGVVIGFIAVQTGSLLPAIAFHFVHNSLGLLIKPATEAMSDESHWLHWLLRSTSEEGQLFHWPVIAGSFALALAVLYWFHKLPYIRTPEENLQQAIDHRTANWLPG